MLVSLIALVLPSASTPVELETRWETSPACVETQALSVRVQGLTEPRARSEARLGLGAERRGDGWRISLELERGTTTLHRTLEGRDCSTLTEAVALVVAVQLDPLVASAAILPGPPTRKAPSVEVPGGPGPTIEAMGDEPVVSSSAPAEDPMPPAEPSTALEPVHAADSSPPSRARPRALVGVAAAGELGVLPRGAAALELAGGVGWTHASLELGALASVGPDGVSERSPAVGGRFRLFTGLLRACGVPTSGRVALPLCGGLELGDLRATGTGLRSPSTVDALWVAAVASARPHVSIGSRFTVGGLFDLVVPLRRHRFAAAEAGLVHAVAPVAVRLGLRLGVRLP